MTEPFSRSREKGWDEGAVLSGQSGSRYGSPIRIPLSLRLEPVRDRRRGRVEIRVRIMLAGAAFGEAELQGQTIA
jgi:hypothetical protein